MNTLVQICQIIVALGLLNVWLLRFNKPTAYRGGKAVNLPGEFAAYGLPAWSCYLTDQEARAETLDSTCMVQLYTVEPKHASTAGP